MTVEVCKEETNEEVSDRAMPSSSTPSSSSMPSSSSSSMPSYPDSFHIKEELDPVFICDVCGLTVDGEEELKDHVVSSHVAMTTVKRGGGTTNGNVDGVSAKDRAAAAAKGFVEPANVMCESCGRCFGRESDFKRHFRAKHFVEAKVVEKMLEIPARASVSLRKKVESLAEDMAARRREHARVCAGKHSGPFGRTINDEIGSSLKDIGRMMKQEFPAYKCGKERKEMAGYIAFRLQCGTDQLKRYLSGRWNNPLLVDPMDIQAMRERLRLQVATAMPDVIANHKSKTQRLSDRKTAPVQSFKWSISTKQTFKQLVDMHLQNMRFDVDVRFDADEKEMKTKVETYLAKLIKTLVSVWPAGWMSERVLMNDCRTATREFLKSLKEKQSEFYEDVYATEDSIPGSPFVDVDDLKSEDCEQVLLEPTPTSSSDLASSSSLPVDDDEDFDGQRTKFVWARRVTLVKGYGRQMRMCLLPLGARAAISSNSSSSLTSLNGEAHHKVNGNYGMFRKKVKADWVFNGTKRTTTAEDGVGDESKRQKVEVLSIEPSGEDRSDSEESPAPLRLGKYALCPHCPFHGGRLKFHLVNHTPSPDRPYKCSYCDFWSGNKLAVFRHEKLHLARSCSEGVSGEGSGDSTLGAETPNRFDAEKWQKQEQMEMDEKRQLKLEANRIRRKNRAKEKKKTLADNLIYYDQDALERGVPMRFEYNTGKGKFSFNTDSKCPAESDVEADGQLSGEDRSDSEEESPAPLHLENYALCPHCPFHSGRLHIHLINHTPSPDRPHKCSYCDFWSSSKPGAVRHEQLHLARNCSVGVGGEGSGDSTPRAETPDRFDEEKRRKQEQKKAEQLEKRMKHEEEKKKEMDEKRQVKEEANRIRKQIKAKERKKTLADNLIYYDRDALETGVPMRFEYNTGKGKFPSAPTVRSVLDNYEFMRDKLYLDSKTSKEDFRCIYNLQSGFQYIERRCPVRFSSSLVNGVRLVTGGMYLKGAAQHIHSPLVANRATISHQDKDSFLNDDDDMEEVKEKKPEGEEEEAEDNDSKRCGSSNSHRKDEGF